MFKTKCPHCGMRLGNYFYAGVCPYCRHELKHNTERLMPAAPAGPPKAQAWPIRWFLKAVRFVES